MSTTSHEHAPITQGKLIRWAKSYDLLVRFCSLGWDRSVRAWTLDRARIRPGDHVLDIGCGTGDLTLAARSRVGPTGRVYGVDASPEMIAVAQRKAAKRHQEVEFRLEPVERLTNPDNSLDVVLSSLMIHHLPGDLKREACAQVYRVLKPGGRFLIVDIAPGTSPNPVHMLHMHRQRTGAPDLEKLLREAGLTVEETGKAHLLPLLYLRAVKP